MTQIVFNRLNQVLKTRGRKRSAHLADVKDGLWTEPVKIGARAVAWPEHENERLKAAQLAGASQDEMRELVKQLHAERIASREGRALT